MESIARRSVLNPLATCFVPSSIRASRQKFPHLTIEEVPLSSDDKGSTVSKKLSLDKYSKTDAEDRESDNIPMKTSKSTELDIYLPQKSKNSILPFQLAVMLNEFRKNRVSLAAWEVSISLSWNLKRVMSLHVLPFLTLMSIFFGKRDSYEICYVGYPEISDSSKEDKRETEQNYEENPVANDGKEDECHYPPMFGWIIPFDFFGNPLKLPNGCKKNVAHTTFCVNETEQNSEFLEKSNLCDNQPSDEMKEKTTVEQCSYELKEIIKDICDSVNSSLSSSFDEDFGSPQLEAEVPDKKPHRPEWNTVPKTDISDLKIIDDGSHPLLEVVPSTDTDCKAILTVQKLLGESLSSNDSSYDEVPSHQIGCDPPCSIWCNNVPKRARESYIRFTRRSLGCETNVQRTSDNEFNRNPFSRPGYKRSFSVDDGSKYSKLYGRLGQSTPDTESREKLLLWRDPVAFTKHFDCQIPKDELKRSFSSLPDCVSRSDLSEDGPNKWGLYAATDSLWKPLPECLSSENEQKHAHKRVREMRRQRSVN